MQKQLRDTLTTTGGAGLVKQTQTIRSDRSLAVRECSQDLGLETFPNDLTRMLYLASLRDCNSGQYLHPDLSIRMGVEVADQALFKCHDQVFQRLLAIPISEYVHQLNEYIRYTRTERTVVLTTWLALQAYRATVPVQALPICCELFCLNIEVALNILHARSAKI